MNTKMHTLKLNIQDSVFDKIIYFLQNLPKDEVEIVENSLLKEDWAYLEAEIDKGINSGVSEKSHNEIISNIKNKYV
ncbi:hypothetical protein LCX93_04320 [Sulfurimonas sp. SWIR-19]|uniref:hypothetical protein n=1 Tax=Sulfurimonas sp. SWIR-19 TaxID=2878390 RepID=UPI001CF58878|nr:hypothetical protein [Sulfurimonas sp. SWIR-19]UCN01146.1 hypothetical protein LCX93_04320 [Sulfurimonas sp. SWIR-19]